MMNLCTTCRPASRRPTSVARLPSSTRCSSSLIAVAIVVRRRPPRRHARRHLRRRSPTASSADHLDRSVGPQRCGPTGGTELASPTSSPPDLRWGRRTHQPAPRNDRSSVRRTKEHTMTYQRRTVGIVAAIVLALLGTMGLVGYVQGAKDDAVAGEKLVKVYVASDKIPAGTSATAHLRHGDDREGPGQGEGGGRRHQPRRRSRARSPRSTSSPASSS